MIPSAIRAQPRSAGTNPPVAVRPEGARFAVESSCLLAVSAYLFAAPHVSGEHLRKQAENDASRVTVGTVPGTVPGVVQAVIRTGSRTQISSPTSCSKAGGAGAVIVGLNLKGTSGPVRKVIRRPTCAATRNAIPAATLTASPVAVRGVIRGAIR